MSGLPTYEETQRGIGPSPIYANTIVHDDGGCTLAHNTVWHQQLSYPHSMESDQTPTVRLQVSLPPEWSADCATLTNYRYQSVGVDHYSLSEPTVLLDRHGRPLRPGGDPFAHYRIGDYIEATHATAEDDLYTSQSASAAEVHDFGHRTADGNTTMRYEEFMLESDDDRSRTRKRTCAKGCFVISLIVSAMALVVFLVIAVLKSIHII